MWYSHVDALVKRTISVGNTASAKVIFKICVPFTGCISKKEK